MQRVLVTGANKGIGLAIATAILSEHDDTGVLLGARDHGRGNAARRELLHANPAWKDRVELVQLDVASDASVKQAAAWVKERFADEPTPLYAIVNNAGVGGASGLEDTLAVNTLGTRRVCEAFVPLLDPRHGRVVNITSAAGPSFVATCSPERQQFFLDPTIDWTRLSAFIDECRSIQGRPREYEARGLADGSPYGLSKALANSYTLLLAREHPSLRINACTPGFIETDMTRGYATSSQKTPEELGMKPPAVGARAPLFLLFGEPEGNGRYYGSDAQRSPLDRYRAPGSEPFRD
jgi:NAD(P)-dependent dehydrogenase (short-subunit alcohol dehydrogenase family)